MAGCGTKTESPIVGKWTVGLVPEGEKTSMPGVFYDFTEEQYAGQVEKAIKALSGGAEDIASFDTMEIEAEFRLDGTCLLQFGPETRRHLDAKRGRVYPELSRQTGKRQP